MGGELWNNVLIGLGGMFALSLLVVLLVWVGRHTFRGVGLFLRHVWRFLAGEFKEALRLIASMLVAPVFAMLALVCLIVFQREPARKLGRALREELLRMGQSVWRIVVGHPARLLGLETTIEGLETRLPSVLSGAFGEGVSSRTGMFPGYVIESTLRAGGSGARLYVARPDRKKAKELARDGFTGERVVIKCFATIEDDALHQIVRESRALEAGRRLGLVLEHAIYPERFYYVMRHVPGESLRIVTSRLHATSGPEGLSDASMRIGLGYVRDLLLKLHEYHGHGLWHKDVKPDNIIVEAPTMHDARHAGVADAIDVLKRSPVGGDTPRGRATLVDFGLVSSLRSGMTLTTHGTEYYRDPEMVRQALRGVKVHEVDGVKFDMYAAGAVMYSVLEDAFPAQGVLSPARKRCPQAALWIVRRAMADYDQRYTSADEMLADVEALLSRENLWSVRPVDLPSMGAHRVVFDESRLSGEATAPIEPVRDDHTGRGVRTSTPDSTGLASTPARPTPIIQVGNWWTGAVRLNGELPSSDSVR
jgi:serine/threonine protein kinase